ncbi:hypothetical protein [Desulfovibrio falkowii]
MKNLALLVCCAWVLVGCGPKIYDNSDPRADWDRDSFQCQQYAEGNTPMPQYTPVPQARTESGYGTVYTNTGPVPFTYTQTYQPDPYAQAGAQLQNAGASWGRIAAIQNRYENCLNSLGWHEVDKDKETRKAKKDLYVCLVIESHNAAKSTDDFEVVRDIAENICEKKTGRKESKMSAYFARQALSAKTQNDISPATESASSLLKKETN